MPKTRGILQVEDPISNANFVLLHNRVQGLEAQVYNMKRLVDQIDSCLQKLLTSEAQAKMRAITAQGCERP